MADTQEIKETLWKKMADSPYLMVGKADGSSHSEPLMAQLDKDLVDTLFFFTGKDNRLAGGGKVMAQFVAKDHYLFACIEGTLVPETDPAIIDRYWSKEVEAWYPGGRNDPNLLMLRFDLGTAEIWRSDMSIKGVFKMLFGGDVRDEMKGKHAEVVL